MKKTACLLSLAALSVSLFAIEPPVAPPSQPAVDQRRQTSERFGFVVSAGGDFSKGTKAWKVARFVRLFYVGYAISQSAPKDVRAEVFRRSLGNNNASWGDLWGAAKDMAKQVAGSGEGTVDLLFAPIAGLEDPEKQYDRMTREPDYIPCADIVLAGLIGQLDAAVSAATSGGGAPSGNGDDVRTGGSASDGYSAESGMTGLSGEGSGESAQTQNQEQAEKRRRMVQQLRKTVTCRDCRGTGWGPPIRGTLAPKFAGSVEEVRMEYCKGCGGIATTDHRHNLCTACHGLGKRRPFLSEIDMD